MTKDLELHIIEIPKAIEQYKKDTSNKVMQWMKFLENPNDKEVDVIVKENKHIKEAKEKLDELSSDKELRRLAFLREKGQRDYEDMMEDAQKKGMAAGMKKGMKKGIEKGIEKGREKGREEEKIKIIKKLYKNGMNIKDIANIVEMSCDEIKEHIN